MTGDRKTPVNGGSEWAAGIRPVTRLALAIALVFSFALAIAGSSPATAGQANEAAAARDKGGQENLVQYDLRVDGMTCPFCVATSEKALKKIPGVHFVHTHLKRGLIHVCASDDALPDDAALARLFEERGFTYRSRRRVGPCPIDGENKPGGKE